MGCDYFVDEEKGRVIIAAVDYCTGEIIDRMVIPVDNFEEDKMDVRIDGAERR